MNHMNHLKWIEHTSTILDIQRTLYEDASTCDVTILCAEKIHRTHKFILSSCSDYFRDILADLSADQLADVTIIVPDVTDAIMSKVLHFIYLGEVSVRSSSLSEFFEAMNLLGIKSAISIDCHMNKSKTPATANIFASIEEESIDADNKPSVTTDEEETTPVEPCSTKDFEYLEVYDETKIGQFTIEHVEQDSNGEYILNENSENSFPLGDEKAGETSTKHSTETIEFTEDHGSTDDIVTMKEEGEVGDDDDDTKTLIDDIDPDPEKMDTTTFNELMQNRTEAFNGAVCAVIEGGMSLQKAATKFNISKTVLWRRVRKHPQYRIYRENPLIESALERLQKGESLKSISLALDIPMSTLHRHKMRLLQQGRLPDHIHVKKRDSKETLKIRLAKAVEACNTGMSQNHAANVFGVPKSTLWRHLQKQKEKSLIEVDDVEEVDEEAMDSSKEDIKTEIIIQEVSLSN